MAKKINNEDYEYDPVKEAVGGEKAKAVVWSTKSINMALDAIKKGLPLKANPFCGQNTKLLRPELVYKRTEEELEEYMHCMQDVLYFASKCYLMTPEGLQPVHLRDYQEEYLKQLNDTNFSIFLSCRQSGKCLNMLNNINIRVDKNLTSFKNIIKKYYNYIDSQYIYIQLPLFEVYNMYCKQTFIWKLKYQLYKYIYKLQ